VTLDRGREFAAALLTAARSADAMLVVIGAAWDRDRNRERLAEYGDWVRREVPTRCVFGLGTAGQSRWVPVADPAGTRVRCGGCGCE
jgi:hypothetical protein